MMTKTKKGFTLIELLVVISIIALLAAVLFPAVTGAINTTKKNRASAECRSIAGAVEMYFSDHGKYPVPVGSQGKSAASGWLAGNDLKTAIRVLTGNPNNSELELNPTEVVYLKLDTPLSSDETFLDPWRQEYKIVMDLDFDSKVEMPSDAKKGGQEFTVRCIVYSVGKDKTIRSSDDVASVNLEAF